MLQRLLQREAAEWADRGSFSEAWRAAASALDDTLDRALLGGHLADRLGYAFLAGYDSALHRLDPGLPRDVPAMLCATEAGGAHPRAIQTVLQDGHLTGEKRWATLAEDGSVLYVLARGASGGRERPPPVAEGASQAETGAAPPDERLDLRVALVRARAPGLTLTQLPPTPFTPEIPHFSVAFADVPVERVLPGDGWADWVRPFRTVEDLHVLAAATAYLLRVARTSGWPNVLITRLTALIVALQGTAAAPRDASATHVALAGCFMALDSILALAPWETVDPLTAERWRRDAAILSIASKARAERTAKAFERLG